jgi:hypothetical protein
MGAVKLIEAGEITVSDLEGILAAGNRHRLDGPLVAEDGEHAGGLDPHELDETFRHLEWHAYEARVVSAQRGPWLRLPVAGPLLRDQHEVNRLVLIAIEKAADLLHAVEKGLGRHVSRYRTDARSVWVRKFRYMGRRWQSAHEACGQLRSLWEEGRSGSYRLRSRAGQAAINPLIETCLVAHGEILSTLQECLDGGELLDAVPSLEGLTHNWTSACRTASGMPGREVPCAPAADFS